ncbi:MAG: hypothetical protein GF365_04580 [Candidatus Buchananbacteria bacterium]|nr:hypothetical protein [Candidatus Buchananbacteria bacterium]
MKKLILTVIVFCLIFASNLGCGDPMEEMNDFLSSNEEYTEICGLSMVFHREWYEPQHEYAWRSVDVKNLRDQKVYLLLTDKSGGIILEKYISRLNERTYEVYIQDGEDVIVEVQYLVDFHWETCGETGTVLEL